MPRTKAGIRNENGIYKTEYPNFPSKFYVGKTNKTLHRRSLQHCYAFLKLYISVSYTHLDVYKRQL